MFEEGDDATVDNKMASLTPEERMGFVRKVYGIVAFSLLITASMITMVQLNLEVRIFMLTHFWLSFVAMIVYISLVCTFMCVR